MTICYKKSEREIDRRVDTYVETDSAMDRYREGGSLTGMTT